MLRNLEFILMFQGESEQSLGASEAKLLGDVSPVGFHGSGADEEEFSDWVPGLIF